MDIDRHFRHYILVGKEIKKVPFMEWAEWLENGIEKRRVAQNVIKDISISTVFLGLDHNFSGEGPPVLFETMIFGGALDQEQWRYCTYDEAIEGHKKACELVIENL